MGLNIRIYNINSPNSFRVAYKFGDYLGSDISGFTNYEGIFPASTTGVTLSGLSIDYNTNIWVKIIDVVTDTYTIRNIKTCDVCAFPAVACDMEIEVECINCDLYFEIVCYQSMITPTPTVTPTITPTLPVTPTLTPTQTKLTTPTSSILTITYYSDTFNSQVVSATLSKPIPSTNIIITDIDAAVYTSQKCQNLPEVGLPLSPGGPVTILAGSPYAYFNCGNYDVTVYNYFSFNTNTATINGVSRTNGEVFLVGTTNVTLNMIGINCYFINLA